MQIIMLSNIRRTFYNHLPLPTRSPGRPNLYAKITIADFASGLKYQFDPRHLHHDHHIGPNGNVQIDAARVYVTVESRAQEDALESAQHEQIPSQTDSKFGLASYKRTLRLVFCRGDFILH